MKRTLLLIPVLVSMMLFVCSCGKSKPASTTEKLISEIGVVSLDSEGAIIEAEKNYAALTEKQKDQVDNYVVLVDARATYDKLVEEENDKEIASNIEKQINELLSQTTRKQEEVDALEKRIAELTDSQLQCVSNADKLEEIKQLTEIENVALAAAKKLQGKLKNGKSLQLNEVVVSVTKKTSSNYSLMPYVVELDYSATNTYGGRVDELEYIDITEKGTSAVWSFTHDMGVLTGNGPSYSTLATIQLEFRTESAQKITIDPKRIQKQL